MFDIPIVINNFNRLTTTKNLADSLSKLGYKNIHILDNNSTYPPLLEWYKNCPYTVKQLEKNLGQLAVYNSDYINKFEGWIVYTDSDIELNPRTPRDFVKRMVDVAAKYDQLKVGLALKIDDLPDTPYGRQAKWWEQRYWEKQLEPNIYSAHVDTTFSIIKVGISFTYEAIRLAGDMTARHIPWYLDYDNLDDEERYIIDNSDSEFSTTKRFVDSQKTK